MSTDPGEHETASRTGVDVVDPVDAEARSTGAAEQTCPSCDAPGAWVLSRRHRFNPFGGVTCLVLAFWSAVGGAVLGFGYLPAAALAVCGVVLIVARRTALVCQVCGFVKPRN